MTDNKIITDREEILEAVKKDGRALQYADESLWADREVVLEAVKTDEGREEEEALMFADESLQADREVVLAAVKQCPWVLEFASEELQNDPELKKLAEG